MIENEQQYRVTTEALEKFERALEHLLPMRRSAPIFTLDCARQRKKLCEA